jgi:DNA-binding NarL/FixJ family response regulator
MQFEGSEKIKVLLVDDQPSLQFQLSSVINAQADMATVTQACSVREAVDLFELHGPDLTVIDLRTSGMEGIRAILAIRKRHPLARFLALAEFESNEFVTMAFALDVREFALPRTAETAFLNALRHIHARDRLIPSPETHSFSSKLGRFRFGPKKREVLKLVAQGMSNKEIGAQLGIFESTVKSHVSMILKKLAVRNRTEAVGIALKYGLLQAPSSDPAEFKASKRERQVLELVAQGMSNKEIGAQLGIFESTVKSHVGMILKKLGVRSRIEAVVIAHEHGLGHL